MRHAKKVKKLKRTASHRKAMLRNMATSLFEHKKLSTTVAKAKALRPYAEQLITKAKHALQNEQSGKLPDGNKIDVHNRRIVGKHIQNKAVLQELFDTIAPMVEDRQGGYTRIIKTGSRRGDAAQTAIIELVDWAAPQDGAVGKKSKKKAAAKSKKAKQTKKKVSKVDEKVVEEVKEEKAEETVEEKVEKKVEEKAAEVKEEKAEEKAEANKEDKAKDKVEKKAKVKKAETKEEEKTEEKTEKKAKAKKEEKTEEKAEEKAEKKADDKPEAKKTKKEDDKEDSKPE